MNVRSSAAEPRGSRLPVLDVLALAASGAVLAVVAENGLTIVQHLTLNRLIGVTTGYLWIVPLCYGIVFGLLAIGLTLLTRLLSRRAAVQLVVTTCGGLVLLVLLILALYNRLNQWSLVLIAVGGGVQLGRLAAARADSLVRRARVFATIGGIAVLLPALLNPWLQRWLERRELSGLPPAQAGAPNVLLIILDTVRAASMSLYGNPRPTTPNLERLAAQGVVFDHAYSTAPWTLPSHASMFTGRYPHELTADWITALSSGPPTLAEAFRDAGYQSAGFVANLYYTTEESGLARGFNHYEDYYHRWGQYRHATVLGQLIINWSKKVKPGHRTHLRKLAPAVTSEFLSWLDKVKNRPFFVFLNYSDAHEKYQYDQRLFPLFKSDNPVAQRYEAAIATLDVELARLIDSLESRGVLKNTLVIITSDHGEQVGEHRLVGHANSLYVQALHVPLMILNPQRLPAGRRIPDRVSLRDLTQTIGTLTGLRHTFPGVSLTRFWNVGESQPLASPILSEVSKGVRTPIAYPVTRGAMKSLVDSNLHFIVNGDGQEELYDLSADPIENQDLAASEQSAGRLIFLRREILKAVGTKSRP